MFKFTKKALAVVLILISVITMIPMQAMADSDNNVVVLRLDTPHAYVNQTKIPIDNEGTSPFIFDRKTYVPIRFINEQLGATVQYTRYDEPIYVKFDDKQLKFYIDSTDVSLNFEYNGSKTYTMQAPARIIYGKTYVPLRDIAELMGYTVNYYEDTAVIIMSNSDLNEEELEIYIEEGNELIKPRTAVKSVSLGSDKTMAKGEEATLKASLTPSNATNKAVLFRSSDTKVVSVTSNGLIKAKKYGTATITVTTGNGKTAKCKITIPAPAIKSFTIKEIIQVAKGGTNTITPTLTPSDANNDLVWSSSNTSVAKVSSKGVVTGVANGTCVVTAKSKQNGKIYKNCVVDVTSDTSKKMMVVYKGSQSLAMYEGEKRLRLAICSTGLPGSETPTGKFNVQFRSGWYEFKNSNCWIKYGIGFYGNYIIHTEPYLSKDSATMSVGGYNLLGQKASHGCVRTAVIDTKWIMENSYVGMQVYITEAEGPYASKPKAATIYNSSYRGWDPTDPDPASPYNK